MIVDLHDSRTADLPAVDVCIVGSGPAGMTLARELAGSGLSYCVLESGRLKTTKHGDALRKVRSEGPVRIKDYSRERVLGGASSTWAGLSAPLDSIELEPRPELGLPGWPIPREELLPYWRRAAADYRFAPLALYEPGGFDALRLLGEAQLSWTALEEKVFLAAAEPQHFGKEHKPVFEAEAATLYLDATAIRLESEALGADAPIEGPLRGCTARGTRIVLRSSDGSERRVLARAIVLATGGLENARLLLASGGPDGSALGNEHDQVGRCLMNHPKNYRGIIRLRRPVRELPYLFGCLHKGYAGYAGLRLSDEEQQRRSLLNAYVRFEPLFPWSDNEGVESLVLLVKRSSRLFGAWKRRSADKVVTLRDYSETGDDSDLQNARKGAVDWLKLVGTIAWNAPSVARYAVSRFSSRAPLVRRVRVRNFMEMEPRPENRVALGTALDACGQPETVVTHGPSELDKNSLLALQEALATELQANDFGDFESDLARADPWPIDLDASHHLGTTRMGLDPESSVTNRDGRLHHVSNVYMAGGSLFPTSGCANPTFTIVALAIRQAEHLKQRLLERVESLPAVVGAAGSSMGSPQGEPATRSGDTRPRRVLVIGAGGRVATDVLPCLRSLPDLFEIGDVFTRSRRPVPGTEPGTEPGAEHSVGPQQTRDFRSLTDEDLAAADLVYVAVSKGAVPAVLKRLHEHPCAHLDVLLDTPVFLFKHLGHMQLLQGFHSVGVAEDCTTLPWLETLRAAQLGQLTAVTFDRSAYRYHAFALFKTLFDGAALKSARKTRVEAGSRFELRFVGGARGTLIEPRDYSDGSWRMESATGVLTDSVTATDGERRLELLVADGRCVGFRIGEVVTELTSEESQLLGPCTEQDTVTTRMEDLKRVGLRRLLANVAEGRAAYDVWNGLDDMFVEWSLDKAGRYRATAVTSMLRPSARRLVGGALGLVSR